MIPNQANCTYQANHSKRRKLKLARFVAVLITGLVPILTALSPIQGHADPEGYRPIPNAQERTQNRAYVRLTSFTTLELVKESKPTHYAQWLTDTSLNDRIARGQFKVIYLDNLDLLNLDLLSAGEKSPSMEVPFFISVRQVQDSPDSIFSTLTSVFQQGTIECSGTITLKQIGDGRIEVKVTKFYDSQSLEARGREYIGTNKTIDLAFAQSVVVPVLENFISQNVQGSLNELVRRLKP
jgi:hypothetical protein